MWKFDHGASKLISQENVLGGHSDNLIMFAKTKSKDLVVISTGNCSNKAELLTFKSSN